MKNNIKVVMFAVLATIVIGVGCFVNFRNNTKESEGKVKLEFKTYDAALKKETLDKTLIAKKDEVIELGEDRNFKILEINEDDIKISREVIKYKIISEEERKAESYKETVTETIKYGERISMNADATDPFGPLEAPRYSSYIDVIKEK